MKPGFDLRGWTLGVLALLLVWPAGLRAQVSDPILDRMHDDAIALAYGGGPDAIEQAVLMHGQVVHQRTAQDDRRFECLKSHANLLYYHGRLEGALLYMEAAAEQAALEGHDFDAAMTYIDAALLAREAGDLRAVSKLAEHAGALSTSPRLDVAQRTEILGRIGA